MKVYIAHSRSYDYQRELYDPIRQHINPPDTEIILPHEPGYDSRHTREFYQSLDLVIAEVSYPATGLGIELGWAYDSHVPIVCIYQDGRHLSRSLKAVTTEFYSYRNQSDFIELIKTIIQEHNHGH